jgi:hypothetical protein
VLLYKICLTVSHAHLNVPVMPAIDSTFLGLYAAGEPQKRSEHRCRCEFAAGSSVEIEACALIPHHQNFRSICLTSLSFLFRVSNGASRNTQVHRDKDGADGQRIPTSPPNFNSAVHRRGNFDSRLVGCNRCKNIFPRTISPNLDVPLDDLRFGNAFVRY